ncbi:MAG: hypothetical protein KI790_09340 [Cyclobacteriaceae bacterium]|nr:hypothetical protein [Cyclobacteriaceae bacterium HetDA_MAG_MS6]
MSDKYWVGVLFWMVVLPCLAQGEFEDVSKSKEEYIKENHLEDIEEIVHQFAGSRLFLEFLLSKGHDVDPNVTKIRRKDVRVGEDIDIHVEHFSEHQNFSMLLIPVDVYSMAIYDTLLFSVLEVSNAWVEEQFYHNDVENDSVKSALLSRENHDLLSRHMLKQALKNSKGDMTEVRVSLHETYISTNSIYLHVSELDKEEKKTLRNSWSLMKKAFSHSIELNVEMNMYIFGQDDMQVSYYEGDEKKIVRITPSNIFKRHHFAE